MADKQIKRRSSQELLLEAQQRVAMLEEKIKLEAISSEEKEKVKLAKRPLINAVNRIKTLEEVDKWKNALEGLVDFKD